MDKEREFFKKDDLTKKYSNKPFPKFLKYIGKIKNINEYKDWLKETNKIILNWMLDYLVILPFVIFLCLSALGFVQPLPTIFLAEGISIAWYLLLSLIKDIRGVIK